MAGHLGIDFGTSNTVVAAWNPQRLEGEVLLIPDIGVGATVQTDCRLGEAEEKVSLIPSLIHYAADGRRWVGQQVVARDLASSPRTFSLIKRYIAHRSPVRRRLDEREISYREAGQDFLSAVLLSLPPDLRQADDEVAITVPVEAFEHYVDWLAGSVQELSRSRFRLIDEASAAALGYGARIQPGNIYLVFDFGGGSLDISVVRIEEETSAGEPGQKCRVLGKAGRALGGASMDAWIMREVLDRFRLDPADPSLRDQSAALLAACRAAKEQLSRESRTQLAVGSNGSPLSTELTAADLEAIFDRNDLFAQIDQTIRRALSGARERGYTEDQIHSVLMVGGSSLIPSVQKTVRRIFGSSLVRVERPLDAVARGAAAFVAGVDFYDHIQHDYAIRWLNPQSGSHEHRVIVRRGTAYPTREPLAKLTVKAAHPGQAELGIAIFELGERLHGTLPIAMELVFDEAGAARLLPMNDEEREDRSLFWVNEQSPTFLKAQPPANPGESRFLVEFGIDANKRLLLTASDLKTGAALYRDHPVVMLS